MKRGSVVAGCVAILVAVLGYLYFKGYFRFMVLNRGARIEVNERPVEGEYVRAKQDFAAVVTRRDTAPARSYLIIFAADQFGDIVVDCQQWIAPRIPIWIETREYPPCRRSKGEPYINVRSKDNGFEFTTAQGDVIRVVPAK